MNRGFVFLQAIFFSSDSTFSPAPISSLPRDQSHLTVIPFGLYPLWYTRSISVAGRKAKWPPTDGKPLISGHALVLYMRVTTAEIAFRKSGWLPWNSQLCFLACWNQPWWLYTKNIALIDSMIVKTKLLIYLSKTFIGGGSSRVYERKNTRTEGRHSSPRENNKTNYSENTSREHRSGNFPQRE